MIMYMLKANNGDAFIIQHQDSKGKNYNLIIDGGTAESYKGNLKRLFDNANKEGIDAIFLTHADDDHIGGLLKFFSQVKTLNVDKVYYNSARLLENKFGVGDEKKNCYLI